ncbi:MAG: PEP-CTERM sorting domain-containing protein [Planctomycetes bacterium]|nr:PEP-CTERM sorting domain-containing protein [Planctomycetota bacterium]
MAAVHNLRRDHRRQCQRNRLLLGRTSGGSFENPGNWTPFNLFAGIFGPPGSDEMATFAVGNSSYTVTFSQDHTNSRLRIGDDHVVFNLNGHTYTHTSVNDIPIIVAGVGFTDDAQLTLTNGTLAGVNATIAPSNFSVGAQLIVGSGANLDIDQVLSVGERDTGSLIIQSGGDVFSSTGILGKTVDMSGAFGNGTVTVTGNGSSWYVDSQLIVGAGGSGSLTIDNGGAVTGFPLPSPFAYDIIGSSPGVVGTVNVTGDGSLFVWGGGLHVGEHGEGHLTVADGATASPTGSGEIGGLFLGSEVGAAGAVLVTGAGTYLGGGTTLLVGRFGSGELAVDAGADLFAHNFHIAAGAGSIGEVVIDGPGSTLTSTTDFTIGGGNSSTGGNGTLVVSNGASVNHAGENMPDISLGNTSSIFLDGGSITAPALTVHGTLAGNGTITADVGSDGNVEPGLSAGILQIAGNYSQQASGTLEIEIGGTAPSLEYDQLLVTGVGMLAGTLTVNLIDGFTPSVGQTFTILTANDVDGTFTTELLPSILNLEFDVVYNAQSVVVAVLSALPGDYNGDGTVDAADYVVWRKNDGTPAGYDTWRAHFGETAGAGGTSGLAEASPARAGVPEPGSIVLLCFSGVGALFVKRRGRGRS